MERIDLELGEFALRRRSVAVSHVGAGLRRGLDPGELVVLRDPRTDRHHAGVVADVTFEDEDTCYRIEVGARMSPSEAQTWPQSVPDPEGRAPVTTAEILRLLAELRQRRRQAQAMADLSTL